MPAWGVFEVKREGAHEIHIAPMVVLDGLEKLSAAHRLDPNCECGTIADVNKHGVLMWWHHDQDHPGAMPEDKWIAKRKASRANA
jgi:hypothetical protein